MVTAEAAWDVGRRSAVVLGCAAVCTWAGPAPLGTASACLAAAVSVPRIVRGRRQGSADAVLVGAGGLLVSAVLAGFALNGLPGGLTRPGCSFGLATIAILGLCLSAGRPAAGGTARRPGLPGPGGWAIGALAALVVVASFGISVWSTHEVETSPLQLSVRGPYDRSGPVRVVVSSDLALGPLQLRLESGRRTWTVGPPFRLAAGVPSVRTVVLPEGRVRLILSNPSQIVPIRSLIIEHGDRP